MWEFTLGRCASVILLVASLSQASTSSADVILYVDDDAPTGGDGLSWDSAYRFLQDAFAYASDPDQEVKEIRVGQGIYQPDRNERNPQGTGKRESTFHLINGIAIMGGYAGIDADDPDARDIELYETILSGDLASDDGPPGSFENYDENSYHIVTGSIIDETAILDGFVITSGNAIIADSYDFGAGIFMINGRPKINNCILTLNTARRGAGMYNTNNSNPTVTNCIFSRNMAVSGSSTGGGMYNGNGSSPLVSNCHFLENNAITGGGLFTKNSSPVIIECTFIMNSASRGGAASFLSGGAPIMVGCTFENNWSEDTGGALLARDEVNISITNCDFLDNSATNEGGAVDIKCNSSSLNGCTFSRNTADYNGGALKISLFGTHSLYDCSFTNNTAAAGGAMYHEAADTLVSQVIISNNSASVGGGLYVREGNLVLVDTTFQENEAVFGGAIYGDHASPTLDGCVIYDNFALLEGGGLFNDMGSPSLYNCNIHSNSTLAGGGGIYTILGQLSLTNCEVVNNFADLLGGGIYNFAGEVSALSTTFSQNVTSLGGSGGGLYNNLGSPTLVNCAITQNQSAVMGGGMYNVDSDIVILGCTFTDNTISEDHGGAIANIDCDSIISNCSFSDNSADGKGGALYNQNSTSQILNCIFWFNQSFESGGGIYSLSSNSTITNATFYANSTFVGLGGAIVNDQSTLSVVNSILWGDFPSEILDIKGSQSLVSYSNIEGSWEGVGNIDLNPIFEAEVPYADQLRLSPGSPCIDAGDNSSLPEDTDFDLDGNPRFVDDTCTNDTGNGDAPVTDMGAYEFQGSSCDLDGDGSVGTSDLLILLANWGSCADCDNCPADLDDNCAVGVSDLHILLGNWG